MDTTQGKLLVKFHKTNCPGCRVMENVLGSIDFEALGVTLHDINIDSAPQFIDEYGLASVPTLILFEGEREIGRMTGVVPADELEEFIVGADVEDEEGDE